MKGYYDMNPKHLFFSKSILLGIFHCLWSWCNDFDTHFRANSKESKLGQSFIIIKDIESLFEEPCRSILKWRNLWTAPKCIVCSNIMRWNSHWWLSLSLFLRLPYADKAKNNEIYNWCLHFHLGITATYNMHHWKSKPKV